MIRHRTCIGLVLALSLGVAFGCGDTRERRGGGGGSPFSPGTWGHLEGARAHWLAQLEPGATISVCGVAANATASALKVWATAAGRDSLLQINADCDRAAERVVIVADRSTASVDRACNDQAQAAGLAIVDYGAILLCTDTNHAAILLHETGHLWGLCDVYPLANGMTDNCDPNYFTGRSRDSVMGANYGRSLALADRLGLAQLTRRGDISGNGSWRPSMKPTVAAATPGKPSTSFWVVSEAPTHLEKSDAVSIQDLPDDLRASLDADLQ